MYHIATSFDLFLRNYTSYDHQTQFFIAFHPSLILAPFQPSLLKETRDKYARGLLIPLTTQVNRPKKKKKTPQSHRHAVFSRFFKRLLYFQRRLSKCFATKIRARDQWNLRRRWWKSRQVAPTTRGQRLSEERPRQLWNSSRGQNRVTRTRRMLHRADLGSRVSVRAACSNREGEPPAEVRPLSPASPTASRESRDMGSVGGTVGMIYDSLGIVANSLGNLFRRRAYLRPTENWQGIFINRVTSSRYARMSIFLRYWSFLDSLLISSIQSTAGSEIEYHTHDGTFTGT